MNNTDKSFIGYAILDKFHRIFASGSRIDQVLTSFSYRTGRLNPATADDLRDGAGNEFILVELYATKSQGTKHVASCHNCGTVDNAGEKCYCGREIK